MSILLKNGNILDNADLFAISPGFTGWRKLPDGTLVIISAEVSIGDGVILGDGVVIHAKASIGSRTEIGDGTRLDRRVRIGEGSFIGADVTIRAEAEIGDRVWIGDGSIIDSLSIIRTVASVGESPARQNMNTLAKVTKDLADEYARSVIENDLIQVDGMESCFDLSEVLRLPYREDIDKAIWYLTQRGLAEKMSQPNWIRMKPKV